MASKFWVSWEVHYRKPSIISLLSLCSGKRGHQHNSKCHMWWWTWYESSSESGRVGAKTKKTLCCLGFHQPCWLHLSWTSVLPSHSEKYPFLCSLTVTHPFRIQITAFCKLVHSIHCHIVYGGFWECPYHQVSLMLYRDQDLLLVGQISTCSFPETSASALKL